MAMLNNQRVIAPHVHIFPRFIPIRFGYGEPPKTPSAHGLQKEVRPTRILMPILTIESNTEIKDYGSINVRVILLTNGCSMSLSL